MNQQDKEQKTDVDLNEKAAARQDENNHSIEALVREEQSFVRRKLLEGLGREPTQAEIDKWLSEQTEGY